MKIIVVMACVFLSACTTPIKLEQPDFEHAVLKPALLDNGEHAVEIHHIKKTDKLNEVSLFKSRDRIKSRLNQYSAYDLEEPLKVLYLKPGFYRLELGCNRRFLNENQIQTVWFFGDRGRAFSIEVKENTHYIVDCEPDVKGENFELVNSK